VLRPFLIALQFLTRLPVRLGQAPEPLDLGRSLLWYPVVGLLLGGLLYGLDASLSATVPLPLRAGLLVAAWVLVTGALHLDGLADSADAWIGGRGERERMLVIMKDPRAGPAAVAAIVVVLLLKFAALEAIPPGHRIDLLLPPLLARAAIPLLFACTPYVCANGIAAAHAEFVPPRSAITVVVASLGIALLTLGAVAAVAAAAAALCFGALRAWLVRRLGGTTGDTAGAMIELIEASVLVAIGLRLSSAAT
jgi:adenosylcobinamide-GDP ribazoletransferase